MTTTITTWHSYPLMHVNKKHIRGQSYINPNKLYKPEFVRLEDRPREQCMWQVSPNKYPWSVLDCTVSVTLIKWVVHVAANSINLSSAYSWLSLLCAFCHSQALVDRYFRGYVTSIFPLHLSCLSIWCLSDPCLPPEGQHDANHGYSLQLFLQSNGSSQLVEQVFKRTGGRTQKCGANCLLPFFLTQI